MARAEVKSFREHDGTEKSYHKLSVAKQGETPCQAVPTFPLLENHQPCNLPSARCAGNGAAAPPDSELAERPAISHWMLWQSN